MLSRPMSGMQLPPGRPVQTGADGQRARGAAGGNGVGMGVGVGVGVGAAPRVPPAPSYPPNVNTRGPSPTAAAVGDASAAASGTGDGAGDEEFKALALGEHGDDELVEDGGYLYPKSQSHGSVDFVPSPGRISADELARLQEEEEKQQQQQPSALTLEEQWARLTGLAASLSIGSPPQGVTSPRGSPGAGDRPDRRLLHKSRSGHSGSGHSGSASGSTSGAGGASPLSPLRHAVAVADDPVAPPVPEDTVAFMAGLRSRVAAFRSNLAQEDGAGVSPTHSATSELARLHRLQSPGVPTLPTHGRDGSDSGGGGAVSQRRGRSPGSGDGDGGASRRSKSRDGVAGDGAWEEKAAPLHHHQQHHRHHHPDTLSPPPPAPGKAFAASVGASPLVGVAGGGGGGAGAGASANGATPQTSRFASSPAAVGASTTPAGVTPGSSSGLVGAGGKVLKISVKGPPPSTPSFSVAGTPSAPPSIVTSMTADRQLAHLAAALPPSPWARLGQHVQFVGGERRVLSSLQP